MTQLVVICLYLLLLLALGSLASRFARGTSSDYLLASHTIGPFLLLMSLFGTTMTAFALVGSSGEAYRTGIGVYGMMASSSGIVHSLCFFLVGMRLWSLGRRHGYRTQIDFFRARLDSDLVGLVLFPILVGLIIPYVLLGIMAGGTVVQTMTQGAFPDFAPFADPSPAKSGGIPAWLGSLVVCLVVLIYVFLGGMRGTAWANAFQTTVFLVLGVVTFLVIARELGGESSLLQNLRKISSRVAEDKLTRSGIPQLKFLTYMLVPLSVGMFPHVFQHWLTARNAAAFKAPIVLQPLLIMLVWVPCVLVGVWATTLELPPDLQPNAVLPYVVNQFSSPWLGGLLAAGILAAIMSSLDSQFLCLGTVFSHDIVERYLGDRRLSEGQRVLLARLFIVAVVAISYLLSLQGYRSIFGMGVWCFSGFASLFPILVAALYWRRLTAAGALAGIVATVGTWSYFFCQSEFGAQRDYTIWGMMPVAPMLASSTAVTLLVSLVTRPPDAATLAKFFPVAGANGGRPRHGIRMATRRGPQADQGNLA